MENGVGSVEGCRGVWTARCEYVWMVVFGSFVKLLNEDREVMEIDDMSFVYIRKVFYSRFIV